MSSSAVSGGTAPSAGSSCAACRSPEVAALFGLSGGLTQAARAAAAGERLAAAGVYGNARHKLSQAAAAVTPVLQRAEEQQRQQRQSAQRQSGLILRRLGVRTALTATASATATVTAATTPPVDSSAAWLPSTFTVDTLRTLQCSYIRDSARIDRLIRAER